MPIVASYVGLCCILNDSPIKTLCNSVEVNSAHKAVTESGPLIGIMKYTEDPIVSTDIKKKRHINKKFIFFPYNYLLD